MSSSSAERAGGSPAGVGLIRLDPNPCEPSSIQARPYTTNIRTSDKDEKKKRASASASPKKQKQTPQSLFPWREWASPSSKLARATAAVCLVHSSPTSGVSWPDATGSSSSPPRAFYRRLGTGAPAGWAIWLNVGEGIELEPSSIALRRLRSVRSSSSSRPLFIDGTPFSAGA